MHSVLILFSSFVLTVVNTAAGIVACSYMRFLYRGLRTIGTILLPIFVGKKEKVPLPSIGNREILKKSASELAELVRLIIKQIYCFDCKFMMRFTKDFIF